MRNARFVVRRGGACLALVLAVLSPAGASPALAQGTLAPPYVFILLDTSGSMNWGPPCTADEVAAGLCNSLCPTGDCFVPLQGDDPASKLHQVKEGLFAAVEAAEDVQLGFASFNQDALRVRSKHWLYQAANDGVTVPGWGPFPAAGAQEVFGYLWNCDTGSGDHEIGCLPTKPADLVDAWELARVQRLPKAGQGFLQDVLFYIRQGAVVYRVRYRPLSGAPGAAAQVRVELERCQNSSCSSRVMIGNATVDWTPVAEFLSWDNAGSGPARSNPQLSYFGQTAAADATATNTCAGWDPNDDTSPDRYNGYNLRWPTDGSDPRGSSFYVGDVIPWDWTDDRRDAILGRLSPLSLIDPLGAPDFRVAPYLRDLPVGGDAFLRLQDENLRPLIATGSTPLGAMLADFRGWYSGCASGSCPAAAGWKGIAESLDPDWWLRRKAVVVITDGDETCQVDPCSVAAALYANEGLLTYVVAYGFVPTPGSKLQCMAYNGGTGEPFYARSPAELETALTAIFDQLRTL